MHLIPGNTHVKHYESSVNLFSGQCFFASKTESYHKSKKVLRANFFV